LFGLPAAKVDVIVHPQSIIHSIVQFEDGSMKAQMGLPDMKLPIQYAMGFPARIKNDYPRFNFINCHTLDFEPPNTKIFRNLALAFEAMEMGGNMPCIMNAANEIVVEAFLNGKISFLQMPEIIEQAMQNVSFVKNPGLDDLIHTNDEARSKTILLIENRK
jgi:1-deoxy-D-xylulose-5-phosphate reductoisomerase